MNSVQNEVSQSFLSEVCIFHILFVYLHTHTYMLNLLLYFKSCVALVNAVVRKLGVSDGNMILVTSNCPSGVGVAGCVGWLT